MQTRLVDFFSPSFLLSLIDNEIRWTLPALEKGTRNICCRLLSFVFRSGIYIYFFFMEKESSSARYESSVPLPVIIEFLVAEHGWMGNHTSVEHFGEICMEEIENCKKRNQALSSPLRRGNASGPSGGDFHLNSRKQSTPAVTSTSTESRSPRTTTKICRSCFPYSRVGHHYFFPLAHKGNNDCMSGDGLKICASRFSSFVVDSVAKIVELVKRIENDEKAAKENPCEHSVPSDKLHPSEGKGMREGNSTRMRSIECEVEGEARSLDSYCPSWTLVFHFLGFSLGGLVIRAALPSLMSCIAEAYPTTKEGSKTKKNKVGKGEEVLERDPHAGFCTASAGRLPACHATKRSETRPQEESSMKGVNIRRKETLNAQLSERHSSSEMFSPMCSRKVTEKEGDARCMKECKETEENQNEYSWKVKWKTFFSLSTPHLGCRVPFPQLKTIFRCAKIVYPFLPLSLQQLMLLDSFIEKEMLSPLYLDALKQVENKVFVSVRQDQLVWSYSSAFCLTPAERMILDGWQPKEPILNKSAFPRPFLSSFEKVMQQRACHAQTFRKKEMITGGEMSLIRTLVEEQLASAPGSQDFLDGQPTRNSESVSCGIDTHADRSTPVRDVTTDENDGNVFPIHYDSACLANLIDYCPLSSLPTEILVENKNCLVGTERNNVDVKPYSAKTQRVSETFITLVKTVRKPVVTYPVRNPSTTPWMLFDKKRITAMNQTTEFFHSLRVFPASSLEEMKKNGVTALQRNENILSPSSVQLHDFQNCGPCEDFHEMNWINAFSWPEKYLPRERRMAITFLEGIGPIRVHVIDFQRSIEDFVDKRLRMSNIDQNIPREDVADVFKVLYTSGHTIQLFPGKNFVMRKRRKKELEERMKARKKVPSGKHEEKVVNVDGFHRLDEGLSKRNKPRRSTCRSNSSITSRRKGEREEDNDQSSLVIHTSPPLSTPFPPGDEHLSNTFSRIYFTAAEKRDAIPGPEIDFVAKFVAWAVESSFSLTTEGE